MHMKDFWNKAYIEGILPITFLFGFISVNKYKTETVKQNKAKEDTSIDIAMQ